jgi:Ino eighty subunit 2
MHVAPSKKKIFTAEEVAMRKVETSRRRKHLLNKKLEEEKTETIDRLLKKQIGRKSGGGGSRLAAATKVNRDDPHFSAVVSTSGAVDENGNPISDDGVPVRLPTSFRWISSIKDGEYKELWNVPLSLEDKFTWPEKKIQETGQQSSEVKYPPPRPPPVTRMLKGSA